MPQISRAVALTLIPSIVLVALRLLLPGQYVQHHAFLGRFTACPAPGMMVDRADLKQTCVALTSSSNATDWSVQLCSVANGCNEGTVIIEYLDRQRCTDMEQRVVWERDAMQEAYVKARGPHTFMVIFDGSERWGTEASEYLGDCRYRFPYRLHNGGQFFLQVKLIYEVRTHGQDFSSLR
jgi:hypothetical protein